MRGPEPRAPELEIPRPQGAGVGAPFSGLSSSLAFELGVCPECGGRLIEHNGLLVCESCGLVAAPLYAPPKLDPTANLAPAVSVNPARGFYERAVEAVAAGESRLRALQAAEGSREAGGGGSRRAVRDGEALRRLRFPSEGLRAALALRRRGHLL